MLQQKSQFCSQEVLPEDYRMIQSISVTNFRGFKSIDLSNMPRFNFLIGESGSGKTAFLESLWIAAGISPEIYFRMRQLRGMAEQSFQLSSEKLSYETFLATYSMIPRIQDCLRQTY